MRAVERRREMGSKKVDDVIFTTESNAPMLAICYAKGWAAHSDYMLRSEAEAVTSIGTAFKNQNSIVTLDLSAFTKLTTLSVDFMLNDTNVTKAIFPYTIKSVISYAVQLNNNYQGITCIFGDDSNGSQLTWMQNYHPIRAVGKLVIYSETPPYWSSNVSGSQGTPGSSSINGSCQIYVPDDAVDTWKNSGSNMWGNYAARIHPISDFQE